MGDPVTTGVLLALQVGSTLLGADADKDAAEESRRRAKIEKRRVAFAKLQEDRKILRETSRERAAGENNARLAGLGGQSSATLGGIANATQAQNVGLGANAANFGFFSDTQDSFLRGAEDASRSSTFGSVASIFGAGVTFSQNRQTQKARNA